MIDHAERIRGFLGTDLIMTNRVLIQMIYRSESSLESLSPAEFMTLAVSCFRKLRIKALASGQEDPIWDVRIGIPTEEIQHG